MKQKFTETSEVQVTREYDIPDEDILQMWDSIEDFVQDLKYIVSGEMEIEDLNQERQEFIRELGCDYDAEQVGEEYWVGADKGNVEYVWVFED